MLIRTSLRQARRAPVRMAACFVLMALVCAFLTIGLNLQASTQRNLDAIYSSYDVIAVPDFQAYVNHRGQLTEMGDHAGYWPCEAVDYDLTPILSSEWVTGVDIQNRFGAFVGNEGFQSGVVPCSGFRHTFYDIIRFVYLGEEPAVLPEDPWGEVPSIPIQVTWSAAGYLSSAYQKYMPFSADHISGITLEPGKEYIASVGSTHYTVSNKMLDQVTLKALCLDVGSYYLYLYPSYGNGPQWASVRGCPYEPIAEYTEDFWQTEQGRYFQNEAKSCYYNLRSLNAVTTGDLSVVLPFYKGGVSVTEGRVFTQEEYDAGAKVCLVSRYLAGLNNWQVGDKIDLSFFQSDYLFSGTTTDITPFYTKPVENFFDQDSYEIVGFYDGLVTGGLDSGGDTLIFRRDSGVLWLDVFLPEKSVENAPTPKLSQYNVTIRLEPLSGQRFLAAMSDSGLMEAQPGGYELGLTLYDQGLSAMADGLAQLGSISRLTVALSSAASLLSVAVLAIFHVWRSKKEIASLRSLGVRRGQVLTVVLAGLMLACFLGCAAGAAAGHMVSQKVAENILASAAEDVGDTSFTANTAKSDPLSNQEEFQLQEGRQPEIAILSACGVTLAMLVFCATLVHRESGRPPLLQLGTKE